MNTPLAPFMPASGMIADKKKRVLLVDTSRTKRDLRSETLRKMGADVDCAAAISEARVWWRPNLYNLVLIHGDTGKALTEKFCEDMRRVMPSQQIMFLVGKPDYLSISRNSDEPFASSDDSEDAYNKITAQVANNGAGSLPQSWGLLEACKRISTARSTANAKTSAMR